MGYFKHYKVMSIAFIVLSIVTIWWQAASPRPIAYVYADMPTYQPDLQIKDLAVSKISPAGFHGTFHSQIGKRLVVEYSVYPSDTYSVVDTGSNVFHEFDVEVYPEGGTIAYRITDGFNQPASHGTEWLYQNLPRPETPTILPPPYIK